MESHDSPLSPSRARIIDTGAYQEESLMKACFARADFLAKALMTAVCTFIMAAIVGHKDIELPLDSLTITAAVFLTLTLVFSYMLLLYVNYMSHHINLTIKQYMLHVAFVSLGGLSLMCTNVLLLALVNWVNAWLGCFLVVVPLVICMLVYAGSRISTNHLPRHQAFKAVMKSCCDVAYLTVGASFFMLGAVVFVYYKNPSLRGSQLPPVDISVTFLASILGVFSMMVTAMPLELLPLAVTSKLLSLVKFLKYSMLYLTGTAAMTLGGKFLDGMIFLTLMPMLVVIVAYQAVLLLTRERVNPDPNNVSEDLENPERVNPDPNNVSEDHENPERVDPDPNNVNEEPEIPGILTGVTNICIGVLSSVYAVYSGGENNDNFYLRASIFSLVGLIVASFSWIAFLLNHSMNNQRAKVTKLVIGIFMGLMITIVAAFLLKIYVDLYNPTM